MKERLQKVIAGAGVCSRREAERLIAAGEVSINGHTVRQPGVTVDPSVDQIEVYGRRIRPERPKLYIALNKPRGCVTTWKDPEGRSTVRDLVGTIRERLFPVGRLDYNAEGLLLLTNDGALAYALTRPGKTPKTYRVKVKGTPDPEALDRLRRGLVLDGEPLLPVRAHLETRGDTSWVKMTLQEGRKNQIIRMMQALGYPVRRLRRLSIGPVQMGTLPSGRWRPLEPDEVDALRRTVLGGPSAQTSLPRLDRNRPARLRRRSRGPSSGRRPRGSSPGRRP